MGNLGGLTKKGNGLQSLLKTVATAGTAEALSTTHKFCKYIIVQAVKGNTGAYVAVADSNVDLATDRGAVIAKGNSVTLYGVYLDEVYADVGTDGDKVSATYEEARTIY